MIAYSVIPMDFLHDKSCMNLHPWTPYCRDFFLHCLRKAAISTFSVLGAVGSLRIAIQLRREGYNLEEIKKSFFKTVRTASSFTMIITSAIAFVCFYRNAFGRFNRYTVLMPGFTGSVLIFLENPDNLNFIMFMMGNAVMEYTLLKTIPARLRTLDRGRKVTVRPKALVLLFIATSGILLQALRQSNIKRVLSGDSAWFFYPPLKDKKQDEVKERQGILHDIKKAVVLLVKCVSIQAAQTIVRNMNRPASLARKLLRFDNHRMGIFFGIYPTLYKIIHATLCRLKGNETEWHNIIAGIIAGSAIYIYPDTYIAVMAITSLLQIMTKKMCKNKNAATLRPWKCLFIMTLVAWSAHVSITDQLYSPRWIDSLLDTLSSGTIGELRLLVNKFWHAARFPTVIGGID